MMEVKRTPTSAYMVDDFQHKLKDRKRKRILKNISLIINYIFRR